METDVGEGWSLPSNLYGKRHSLCCCDVLGQKLNAVKTGRDLLYMYVFLVNTLLKTIHWDLDKPVNIHQ